MPRTRKEVPWNRSKAKALLMEGLRVGFIPMDNTLISLREIAAMYPEFGGCDTDLKKFSSRLRNARIYVRNNVQRALSDKLMIEHDIELLRLTRLTSNSSRKIWHGSAAEMLLLADVDNEMHTKLRPQMLYNSRPEYKEFSLDIFRGHIYQEIRTRKFKQQFLNRKI